MFERPLFAVVRLEDGEVAVREAAQEGGDLLVGACAQDGADDGAGGGAGDDAREEGGLEERFEDADVVHS
ncbi:hypothetical protein V493_04721 [Pseudogymnoascus sp. VKM F-4281 (FW-2241)]|nr:hypothetical protein V493_04721 [Pseudogymnoascus sp. VKM F-4281 (FW-2241)]